ncbi:porin family protein [Endozoicomonas gorgoniicola]|uniref:Porin family protein n=1 Tax=Endozoicomonas gorgoniicola TaxID=1234144 RepID=A0ABT3N184_9GAMM|nr:porin family protein [Endozoicomonas gorgoniicola]MCW7555392.1 porin family protein [Endozoicomonas gorgoniicola]
MKKIISTALMSAALMSGATAAQAGDWFAGIEAGKAKSSFEFNSPSTKETDKKVKNNSFGIRVGKYLNDNVRVYGTYSQNKSFKFKDENAKKLADGKVKEQTLMASVDYVFMEGSAFRPFVGASLGANKMKVEKAGNKTSAVFGAQTGVMYQVGPVDAELGLRYRAYGNEVKKDSFKLKHKNAAEAYLSVAYRF